MASNKMNGSIAPMTNKKHIICRYVKSGEKCPFGPARCHYGGHESATTGGASAAAAAPRAHGGGGGKPAAYPTRDFSSARPSGTAFARADAADDGWTPVVSGGKKPAAPFAGAGGGGGGGKYTPAEMAAHRAKKATAKKLHTIQDEVRHLIETNGGTTEATNDALVALFDGTEDPVKRAQVLHELATNSLHEFMKPDSPLGKRVAAAFAAKSSLFGLATARDGYNMYALAAWPKWKKNPIAGMVRDEGDIIQTIEALLNLGLNPFTISAKKSETVFDSMAVAVESGKLTAETAASIEALILEEYVEHNPDLYIASMDVMHITERRENKFHKTLWRWALNQPSLAAPLAELVASGDMLDLRCQETRGRGLDYTAKFGALLELVRDDAVVHGNFTTALTAHPIDKERAVATIAGVYMDLLATAAPKVEARSLDGAATPGKIAFASPALLGSFAFDIAAELGEMPEAVYAVMPLTAQIAYAARARDVPRLRVLAATDGISPFNKVSCELWLKDFGAELAAPAAVAHAEPLFIKLGLESIKEGAEVAFTAAGSTHPAVDDALYTIERTAPTVDAKTFAKAFCMAAVTGLDKAHKLAHLVPLASHLVGKGWLSKAALSAVLENEDDMLDIEGAQDDNPRCGAGVIAVLRAFAE